MEDSDKSVNLDAPNPNPGLESSVLHQNSKAEGELQPKISRLKTLMKSGINNSLVQM
jgi:hypothetical protein